MVMGDDSCLRGHGFESWPCIWDGHAIFDIDLLCKLYCLFRKDRKYTKRGLGFAHFFKNVSIFGLRL